MEDIDYVVEALKTQLTWVDSYVDSNIDLLQTVAGFENSIVKWDSLDKTHCKKSGKIIRDIVDVKVQLIAKITWQKQKRTITFSATIKKFEKIEQTFKDDYKKTHIRTWDFSKNNVLKLFCDGKETHLWEIKSVDVEKKEFVAKLKKIAHKNDKGNLLELENYANLVQKINKKYCDNNFGDAYIALKNKNIITWQDLKEYLSKAFSEEVNDFNLSKNDKTNFNIVKTNFLTYEGTFAEFNALGDYERTKLVKNALNKNKERFCNFFGIPKNTLDDELVKTTIEKMRQRMDANIERASQEQTFEYLYSKSFHARTIYDSTKKWFEQLGRYACYISITRFPSINVYKINDSEMEIYLNFYKPIDCNEENFYGICQISEPNVFILKQSEPSLELQCEINDDENGKFKLTTKGAFEESFEMNFISSNIEDLLGF